MQYGGAYINCWINVDKHPEAESFARKIIDEEGWIVEGVEESYPITLEDYSDNHSPEGMQSIKDAIKNGSSFTFHTFPNSEMSGGVA
jgi:hypothetical protein